MEKDIQIRWWKSLETETTNLAEGNTQFHQNTFAIYNWFLV